MCLADRGLVGIYGNTLTEHLRAGKRAFERNSLFQSYLVDNVVKVIWKIIFIFYFGCAALAPGRAFLLLTFRNDDAPLYFYIGVNYI